MEDNIVHTSFIGAKASSLLAIALIVLKAIGVIGMPWFWVITSFIWIPICFFVVAALVISSVVLGIPFTIAAIGYIKDNRKFKRLK